MRFVRKKLQLKDHESVFCYVNSVFHPSLDENVGNLWRVSGGMTCISIFAEARLLEVVRVTTDIFVQCFKTGDELVVSYSVTQAFG